MPTLAADVNGHTVTWTFTDADDVQQHGSLITDKPAGALADLHARFAPTAWGVAACRTTIGQLTHAAPLVIDRLVAAAHAERVSTETAALLDAGCQLRGVTVDASGAAACTGPDPAWAAACAASELTLDPDTLLELAHDGDEPAVTLIENLLLAAGRAAGEMIAARSPRALRLSGVFARAWGGLFVEAVRLGAEEHTPAHATDIQPARHGADAALLGVRLCLT